MDYPKITAAHIAGAALYADRFDMVRGLKDRLPPNPAVCEVGVALGDFSQFLMDELAPKRFVGLDLFGLHELDTLWGRPTSDIFQGKDHATFYRDRFPNAESISGDSGTNLNAQPDGSFDLIYLDGDHSYQGVMADIGPSLRKVTPTGLLIFNDYIMYDHIQGGPYGVVQAVNELVDSSNWRIVGFALQHFMFCDIALRRVG